MVDGVKKAFIARVMLHPDRLGIVQQRIIPFQIPCFLYGQNTPEEGIKRGRDGDHSFLGNALLIQGFPGHMRDVELGPHAPHQVKGGKD